MEAGALDERARRLDVNPLPTNVIVREARQVRDFGRERAAGVVAVHFGLVVENLDEGALEGVRERQHRELDDRLILRTLLTEHTAREGQGIHRQGEQDRPRA